MVFFSLLSIVLLVVSVLGNQNFHGGSFIAIAGRRCVVMASDSRFSSAVSGSFLLNEANRKILSIGNNMVALDGVELHFPKIKSYLHERLFDFSPNEVELCHVVSLLSIMLRKLHILCSPLLAGISPLDQKAVLCRMDIHGSFQYSDRFLASGTSRASLEAICGKFYHPDMEKSELISLASKCMTLSLDRDVLSGGTVRILCLDEFGLTESTIFSSDT